MKKRSAWFAAWFAVLIIGVVAMMAVAPMGKAAEQKQFIVGFDAEFPPYGYMDDNGEYVGFDLDLAAEVCKRNGWKLVKRPIAWDSKDSEKRLASAVSHDLCRFALSLRNTLNTGTVNLCEICRIIQGKSNDNRIQTIHVRC